MPKIVSYDDRVAKMEKPGDEEVQILHAKKYVARLRTKAKSAGTLAEKLELQSAVKEAEGVLRKLRLNVFDLEDMLIAKANGNPA